MASVQNFILRRVAVLGAGVMGAQIAAHFANARVEVLLYDLSAPAGDPSAIALKAIEGLKKLSPAPLASAGRAQHIRAVNYDQHLPLLAGCDLVVEAIAERLEWKLALYERIAPHLGAHTLLVTNTSGLSIAALGHGVPATLQARFCGVHFFNPPRYMHLVELIATEHTAPELLDCLETMLVSTLGKGVVRARNTPNFIANRIGVFSLLATIHNARLHGLRLDVVDDLTGTRLGRPKSATFRTADVVGLDIFAHVVATMTAQLPDDPWAAHYGIPAWIQQLIQAGSLGQKSGGGMYRKEGKLIKVFDPDSGQYISSGAKADESVKAILKGTNPAEKMAALRQSDHPQAQFLWATYRDVFHYIAYTLAEIADNARDVDFAVRWGYGWELGPFETWQAAGWQQVAGWIAEDIAAGKAMSSAPLPDWVTDGRTGVHTPGGSWSPTRASYVPRTTLPVYQRQLYPAPLLGEERQPVGHTVFETDAVRLADIGDGILALSFKTKMHAISLAVLEGMNRAMDIAEARYRGLVLWHPDEPFSAGADLSAMLPAFMTGQWAEIEAVVVQFQATSMRLRYCQTPVVAAVRGLALGGGCEFVLHSDRVVAALESYVGLVEVGVGLLPGGGGCKEMARRAALSARGGDVLASMKDAYMAIATAQVAKSAQEARDMGYLQDADLIVFNPYELLHVAKQQAILLAESGYRAPMPATFPVAGRAAAATIKGQLINMLEGRFISAYDYHLGCVIADVMTGGDLEAGTLVDESWLLTLERQAFMALLQNPKTQDRIANMLSTGKPLRN
jgi:3-hydroxyacyl-CoA dehydrogenase